MEDDGAGQTLRRIHHRLTGRAAGEAILRSPEASASSCVQRASLVRPGGLRGRRRSTTFIEMLTWPEFRRARPDLADAGRALLYQFSVGLAFLATVRRDGGPRVHPMCPIIVHTGLFAFIVPSPKRRDLVRDGRYAMHGFPPANNEDAIYLTGRAESRTDPDLRASLARVFVDERTIPVPPPGSDDLLFEFLIESCLLTKTTGHGDPDPKHTVWKAAG